jgi:O-acetylhomoserine (thiol)-lyase
MRDFGSIQSPQNAFILNLGLESLHVRMARHCENGLAVAKFLQSDDRIAWVTYPGLEGDKYYDLACKYMPNGTCGVVSFGVKGGREAAEKFMGGLKIAAIETHVADARSCCLHPASATHRQLSDEMLVKAGIDAGLIRISVGIEDVEDIIADLKSALEKTFG